MSQQQDPQPTGLVGGRAFALSIRGTWAVLAVWLSVVMLALADSWQDGLTTPLIWIIAVIGGMCGGQHLPNIVERLPGTREFKNGAP